MGKIGVILMAYGSPSSLDELPNYLLDIRRGRPFTQDLLEDLRSRYLAIGGLSPLTQITQSLARKLSTYLNEHLKDFAWIVGVGMKHSTPRISSAVRNLWEQKAEVLVPLVLAPHYSSMSVAEYQEQVKSAIELHKAQFAKVVWINSWHDDPGFINLLAQRVRDALDEMVDINVEVVFTAHSLPERIIKQGDPYKDQLLESSYLVAKQAGVESWRFAFQSQSHTGEPWLGPDLLEVLEQLKLQGRTRVLVVPIGFTADHLEILYDIGIEARKCADSLGIELRRTRSLNDNDDFVYVLANLIEKRLEEI